MSSVIICFVPQCPNTSENSPNKLFVRITQSLKLKWYEMVGGAQTSYCCEDHLNLREDLENYYKWKLMNARPKLKNTATLYLMEKEVEMEDNINYIPPDVCRLCLKTNGELNLTDSVGGDAEKETYNFIIKDCFSIQISHLSEWIASQKLCNSCACDLQSAYKLKKQILDAEKMFNDHIKKLNGLECTTVAEQNNSHKEIEHSIMENGGLECTTVAEQNYSHKEIEHYVMENGDSEEILQEEPEDLLEHTLNVQAEEVKIKMEPVDCVMETPVDEIIQKICENNVVRAPIKQPRVKQISQRRRVLDTCKAIFTYTTTCPFRHRKSWFQCFFCQETYMEISTLKAHMRKEHKDIETELNNKKQYPNTIQLEITNLKCKACKVALDDIGDLKDHLESKHDTIIYKECIADYKINKSPFYCHVCNKEFHVFRSLTTHINAHYPNFICDVCGKPFLSLKRCNIHKLTHEVGTYPCGQCDRVLKSKMSKMNHVTLAHKKRIMKCHICFKVMKHYNDRVKHMSAVHGVTHKFPCRVCGKEFIQKHYLATHMRQTHGQKDKKCSDCPMVFITNHELKKHMVKHSGEKPYTCSTCSKSYSRYSTLREHMKVHTENVK